jgi:hypothetical protein
MLENLQSKLQNRNTSWDTIAYMTAVLYHGNENATVSFLSFFLQRRSRLLNLYLVAQKSLDTIGNTLNIECQ